jgi:probable F420-dependent oxidoreductase
MAIVERTRIGIATPHMFMDGKVDMELVRRYVHRAEELGFSSLWTQERLTGAPTVIDPLSFLSYLAGQTTKARLGVSVVVLPRHNPIHLAKQTASIDQMSGGRLILGVGLGAAPQDLVQYGLSPERRVRRFLEHVEIIKALWTQDNVHYEGDFYNLEGTNIAPKPAQSPHPPLWFGANAEAAIRRAVKYADGWTGAGSSGAADFPKNVALVQSLLAADGRTQADFPISKRVYLAIDDDEARGLRRLKEWSGSYYGNPDIAERAAIWGSASKIQEKLAEWSELGVDEFVLNPVVDVEETMEQLAVMTGLTG